MGNLGFYQTATKVIKTVGGPKRFLGLVAAAMGGIGITGGVIGYKLGKASSHQSQKRKPDTHISKWFIVTSDGVDEQGLKFCTGEKYRVLESDKDAVLIEKNGDSRNPYFVSAEFLHSISDFEV